MTWDEAVAQLTGPDGAFELVDAEVMGVATRVYKSAPPTLRNLFDFARLYADKEYLVFEDERWTYADLVEQIDGIADALVNRYGVAPGDRVAIAMRNYPEWITAFAAITSVGGIAVALNAWWLTDELTYGIEDSGSKVAIVDQERVGRIAPLLAERDELKVIVVRSDGAALPAGVDRVEDVIVPGRPMPEVTVDTDADATILYTSGTTGNPKGAVSTHRAVINALLGFACRAQIPAVIDPPPVPAEGEEVSPAMILCVPLFHVTGLVPVMMGTFVSGAKLVMMYKWNAERALELIERERITQFVGVPTMSWELLESPDFATRDTSSLASVGGGGAPAPPELVKRVEDNFAQARPGIGYGMTETNALGPQNSGDDYLAKPTSAGRPAPSMGVRVVDPAGNVLGPNERGEICFSGPNLIRCYWNKPEATADTIKDGWLHSGDIGFIDEDGFVFVADRAKDMVIRAGENIYCAEVEAAIYEHPAVYEAACFGLPHERLGEELAAAVMPKPGMTIEPDELRAFVAERLASFKVPARVEIYPEQLPRNASGKILKREIRDSLLET